MCNLLSIFRSDALVSMLHSSSPVCTIAEKTLNAYNETSREVSNCLLGHLRVYSQILNFVAWCHVFTIDSFRKWVELTCCLTRRTVLSICQLLAIMSWLNWTGCSIQNFSGAYYAKIKEISVFTAFSKDQKWPRAYFIKLVWLNLKLESLPTCIIIIPWLCVRADCIISLHVLRIPVRCFLPFYWCYAVNVALQLHDTLGH